MSATPVLDWLAGPEEEQLIMRSLVRRPQQTAPDLAGASALAIDELEPLLERWTEEGRLVEQLIGGQRTFSVRFGRPRRAVRNMPAEIYHVFEQPPDTFLAETALTSLLTPEQRESLLASSLARKVVADEVVTWQGQQVEHVGLVRVGLLKRSRLQGNRVGRNIGYRQRGSWFSLGAGLQRANSLETLTAVADSELLLWPVETFIDFIRAQPHFGLAIGRFLGRRLYQCERAKVVGRGKLWVIEGARPGVGATTVAARLAALTARAGGERAPRVLLWDVTERQDTRRHFPQLGAARPLARRRHLAAVNHRLDVLLEGSESDYAPHVQLNISLSDVLATYQHIICDSGAGGGEFVTRLRGQAHTLITLTDDDEGAAAAQARWATLKKGARPGQKRLLALNKHTGAPATVDPRFHLRLPHDSAGPGATAGPLQAALDEVHRRLTLTHAIAVFVPSTLDVTTAMDNAAQVEATLSFLGGLFGGATRSEAEGVWQSEESGLVTEQVTIVRTFVSQKALNAHLDQVVEFAVQLKQEMKQEAIALDIDNQLVLV